MYIKLKFHPAFEDWNNWDAWLNLLKRLIFRSMFEFLGRADRRVGLEILAGRIRPASRTLETPGKAGIDHEWSQKKFVGFSILSFSYSFKLL